MPPSIPHHTQKRAREETKSPAAPPKKAKQDAAAAAKKAAAAMAKQAAAAAAAVAKVMWGKISDGLVEWLLARCDAVVLPPQALKWLKLQVHPDKCKHPRALEAFTCIKGREPTKAPSFVDLT